MFDQQLLNQCGSMCNYLKDLSPRHGVSHRYTRTVQEHQVLQCVSPGCQNSPGASGVTVCHKECQDSPGATGVTVSSGCPGASGVTVCLARMPEQSRSIRCYSVSRQDARTVQEQQVLLQCVTETPGQSRTNRSCYSVSYRYTRTVQEHQVLQCVILVYQDSPGPTGLVTVCHTGIPGQSRTNRPCYRVSYRYTRTVQEHQVLQCVIPVYQDSPGPTDLVTVCHRNARTVQEQQALLQCHTGIPGQSRTNRPCYSVSYRYTRTVQEQQVVLQCVSPRCNDSPGATAVTVCVTPGYQASPGSTGVTVSVSSSYQSRCWHSWE